jgi:hypothetical protein
MPSPFAKYQSEQVQQLAPGFVEAYGNAGRSIGQGLASAAESIGKGMMGAEEKRKNEIATRAKLAPYIRNDDRITATEGMIKSGLLTKADDGTVVVSAKWDKYADKKGLAKFIDFYNQTGGDGSKLSGDALIDFANRFEGEQKFIAEKAANAKAKTETELKQAQIAKFRAEAAAKAAETGLIEPLMKEFMGGSQAPDSPTAGIDLSRYVVGGGSLAPTTTPGGYVSPSVTTVADTVPGVAAPAAEPAVSPALTAGTKAAPEAPAAPSEPAPTSADFDKYGYPKKAAPTPAAAPAPTSADFDKYGYPKKAAATAEQPAEQPAAQAQQEQRTTAAGTPIPETYDVAAESVAVKERLDKVNTDREAVRTKYSTERTKNAATLARQRQQALALGVVAPQKASAITSYLENSVKFQNEAEARELKALDDKEAAINRDFANYQAADKAQKAAKTEARLDRAAALAETKAATEAKDAKQRKISDYPTIGIWTHLGANVSEPWNYNIRELDPSAKMTVNEANEGFRTSTDFLLRMSETLEKRVKGDSTWRNRFRVTAENMQNYFEGELASVFGVATMRRGIVSGGNFSDADREFVKSAITYLNTAALDMDADDLKASMNALSVFINRMFVKKLEAYDMVYDPDSAKSQAAMLRKDGYDRKAEFVENAVTESDLFFRKFNIKPPMKSGKAESQLQVKEAMDLLYPLMEKKGLTKKFKRTDITVDK